MKILAAWDSLQDENRMLKIFILVLFVTMTLLTVAVVTEAQKPALVIERGCTTLTPRVGKTQATDDEIKSFIELALHARFDSKLHDLGVMTPEQQAFRAIEQKDLESQKMRQTLVVNLIEIKDGEVIADCDRLIAVGLIRSTFRFPLKIEFESIQRTQSNPYGLILKRAEPLTPEVKK